MRSAYIALSLVLIGCTAAPTLQKTRLTNEAPSAISSAVPETLQPETTRFTPIKTSPFESVKGNLNTKGNQDRLTLSVGIHGRDFKAQRLELEKIENLKAWVAGPGIDAPIFNSNNFVPILSQSSTTTLDITQVPRGKHRIVTVQGYQSLNQNAAEEVNGATLKAVYNSPENSTQITLDFNWRSTAEAEIIEALFEQAQENTEISTLLENLDRESLNTLLDTVIYGPNPTTGINYVIHPNRLNPEGIANALIAEGGTVPTYTVNTPVPEAWVDKMADVTLTIRTPRDVAFSNSDIQIQLTDPASAPIVISNGSDTANISQIVPGQWDAIVSIPGLNGGVSSRATVTVNTDGTATLTEGTTANPIVLPPVIKSIDTTAFSNAGDRITLNGDGFDTTNPVNNTVKIGGVDAVIISATSTQLIVAIPPEATGTNSVSVTSNTKTSNVASLDVPVRIVKLDTYTGSPTDEVTITVVGYDPTQTPTTVRFKDSLIDAEIVSTTGSTIKVKVPADAAVGPITLSPDNLQPLITPNFSINNAPTITSINSNGPYVRFANVILSGVNIADATQVTVAGIPATITGNLPQDNGLNRPFDQVFIRIPSGAEAGSVFEVTTPNGVTRITPPAPEAAKPPTIAQLTPPDPNLANPEVTLTGDNYTTVNQLFIGGIAVPNLDYTIVDDNTIKIRRLSNNPVLGNVKVVNPDGEATASLTYKNVENYIGLSTGAPETQINHPGMGSPHGINVDREHNIYTAGLGGDVYKFAYDPLTKTHSQKWVIPVTTAVGTKEDIANDLNGNIYVASTSGNQIQKITVETDINNNEQPSVSILLQVPSPEGLETDAAGNLYVTSTSNTETCLFKLSNLDKPSPNTTTIQTCNSIKANPFVDDTKMKVEVLAGGTKRSTTVTTPAVEPIASAQFDHLEGLGIDGQGRFYLVEVGTKRIRRIDPQAGEVTIFADLSRGTSLNEPRMTMHEIRVDRFGNVFVPSSSDSSPAKGIYLVTPEQKISFIAGDATGLNGLNPGAPLTEARFTDPRGIDFGPDGSLYIVDIGWGVRKIERFHPVSNLQVP